MKSPQYYRVYETYLRCTPDVHITASRAFELILLEIKHLANNNENYETNLKRIMELNEKLFFKQMENYHSDSSSISDLKEDNLRYKIDEKRNITAMKKNQIIYHGKYELMSQTDKDKMMNKEDKAQLTKEERDFMNKFNKRNNIRFQTKQEQINQVNETKRIFKLTHMFQVQHENENKPIEAQYSDDIFKTWINAHKPEKRILNVLKLDRKIHRFKLKFLIQRYNIHSIKSKHKLDIGIRGKPDMELNYIYDLYQTIKLGEYLELGPRKNVENSVMSMEIEEGIWLEKVCINDENGDKTWRKIKNVDVLMKTDEIQPKEWKNWNWKKKTLDYVS